MPRSALNFVRTVAFALAVCGFASVLALVAVPVSANAQVADLSVTEQRLLGVYVDSRTPQARMEISLRPEGLYLEAIIADVGRVATAQLKLSADRRSASGPYSLTTAPGATGSVVVAPGHDYSFITVTWHVNGPVPGFDSVAFFREKLPSSVYRVRNPESSSWLSGHLGDWYAPEGQLRLAVGGVGLGGVVYRTDIDGDQVPWRDIHFSQPIYDADFQRMTVYGSWDNVGNARQTGDVSMRLSADQRSMVVSFRGEDTQSWSLKRDPLSGEPAGGQDDPGSEPTPEPSPEPEPQQPAPQDGFQSVGKFDVRFDRLERPRGSAVVRAVVTIRNATETIQYAPSGTFRAILTDADGAGQERNQLWRGSGEPAQLFNGTPTLQPGGELTVRFVFNPDTPQLRSLTLMQGTEQVDFDLGGA